MGRDGREEEHKVGDGLVLAEEMGGRRVWLSSTYLVSGAILNGPRRKWQSTPVPLPGKSHGWGSLIG